LGQRLAVSMSDLRQDHFLMARLANEPDAPLREIAQPAMK